MVLEELYCGVFLTVGVFGIVVLSKILALEECVAQIASMGEIVSESHEAVIYCEDTGDSREKGIRKSGKAGNAQFKKGGGSLDS